MSTTDLVPVLQLHKEPLTIGSRKFGCNDKDGVWHGDQPYVLLREVTVEEFRTWCKSQGAPWLDVEIQIRMNPTDRYFEVAID